LEDAVRLGCINIIGWGFVLIFTYYVDALPQLIASLDIRSSNCTSCWI